MLFSPAPAGIGRSVRPPVDENAITLKLRPLRWRDRHPYLAHWRLAAAAFVVGASAVAVESVDRREAEPQIVAIDPIETPSFDAEPVLASAVVPVLDPVFEVEEEIVILDEEPEEIVIIVEEEEPAPPPKPSRRARARTVAREHMNAGETARSLGDMTTAMREFQSAATALPSYAPAAAALSEIHMQRRSYRAALRWAKRASRSAPRKLDYLLLLGDAYLLTNNRRAAEKTWRKAAAWGSAQARSRLAT